MLQRSLFRQRKLFFDAANRIAAGLPPARAPLRQWDFGITFLGLYWLGGNCRTSWGGPILEARRVSDGAVFDVYSNNGTGLTDINTLSSMGSASILKLVTIYDQSGNDRHLRSPGSREAIIWDPASGPVLGKNGYLAAKFDGVEGNYYNMAYGGGPATGLVGNPLLTVAWDQQPFGSASLTAVLIGDNTGTNPTRIDNRIDSDSLQLLRYSGTVYRQLSAPNNKDSHSFILEKPSGATLAGVSLRRDGVALTDSASSGATTALTLAQDAGVLIGTYTSSTAKFSGLLSHLAVITSSFSALNRGRAETWYASYGC